MSVVNKRFGIALDMKEPVYNDPFEVVEGDTGNILVATVTDDGEAVALSDCRILVIFARPDGLIIEQDNDGNGVTIDEGTPNVVEIELYATSFSFGEIYAELQVYSGDGYEHLVTSAQFNFKCRRGISNDDTMQATKEWPLLQKALNDLADIERGVQADMAVTDDGDPAYVKNKPTIPSTPEEVGAAPETHASQHAAGGDDAVTPASILAASKSTMISATLLAANWVDKQYTLAVSGATVDSAVEVLPGLAITEDQLDELQAANLQDGGQAAGSITLKAFGDVPTADIPVRVIVRGDLYT